jgi:hypothetical protein
MTNRPEPLGDNALGADSPDMLKQLGAVAGYVIDVDETRAAPVV